MKVLFLQNLEHQKVGDVKNVPDGYARNFLLPKGIAIAATDDNVQNMQSKIDKIKKEEETIIADLQKLAEKIENESFTVAAQAGDEGKLFGAVTNRDLAEALEKKKITVDKHEIEILNPIHELGEHTALVKLGHGIHANMKVIVERVA